MLHILRCKNCGKYTLSESCMECRAECVSTKPAKFSIEDRYAKYRITAKKEKGVL